MYGSWIVPRMPFRVPNLPRSGAPFGYEAPPCPPHATNPGPQRNHSRACTTTSRNDPHLVMAPNAPANLPWEGAVGVHGSQDEAAKVVRLPIAQRAAPAPARPEPRKVEPSPAFAALHDWLLTQALQDVALEDIVGGLGRRL